MIILQANKIERSFAGELLFDNITLQVDEGDRIALVGRNGAGKSTLLKILVGEEAPTSGSVSYKRDLSVAYLAQDSHFEPNGTIYEELLRVFADLRQMEADLRRMELKMAELTGGAADKLLADYDRLSETFRSRGGFTYERDIKAILTAFKFSPDLWDRPAAELSGGQQTRLALARMLLEAPDLLVLDEPTNHLDIETIAWLENYLLSYRGALILVSHDRYFLDKVTNLTLDLTPHALDRYPGNYSRFVALKAEKQALAAKQHEKQAKEIARLEDFVQRNLTRASTSKRAQSRRKQLDKMERLDKPEAGQKSAHMTFRSGRSSGKAVLSLEAAAIGYDNAILAQPISLDLRKHEALALVGPNGVGKTTLLKSLIGQLPLIKGEVRLGANVDLGYYDQDQSRLTPSNTVLDELWNDFKTTPEVDIRNRLGAFLFSGDDVKKTVSMLSGGERARLLLAKLSMEDRNLLILDEPTNHLDIDSKEVLEQALLDFDGTLLFVSHDRYFINRIATQVLEISAGGSTLYLGDYDYYLTKKAEQAAALSESADRKAQPEQVSSDSAAYQASKADQRERRKLSRRIEQLEGELEELDSQIAALHDKMAASNDAVELMDLQAELDQYQQASEERMLEWETLSEQAES